MAYAPAQSLPIVNNGGAVKNTAYLVKFPDTVWRQIVDNATGALQIVAKEGKMSLALAGVNVPMEAYASSTRTEIYSARDEALVQLGSVTARLSVPFEQHPTPSSQDEIPVAPLEQKSSSPAVQAAATTPNLPLKTRVLQALAPGEVSVSDIAAKVQSSEADVMRVVKIVGKVLQTTPLLYGLLPSQYPKIRIVDWNYSKAERERVVACARAAFNELGLGPEAPEWAELEPRDTITESAAPPDIQDISPVTAPPVAAQAVPPSPTRPSIAKLRADRGRATSAPVHAKAVTAKAQAPPPAAKAKAPKRRRTSRTPHFTSSEEDESPSSGSSSGSRRKHQRLSPVRDQIEPDPERMRDRYDELYPAYQKLTLELAAIHEAAERDRLHTPLSETERMVLKWERWHAELSRIRFCFGEI